MKYKAHLNVNIDPYKQADSHDYIHLPLVVLPNGWIMDADGQGIARVCGDSVNVLTPFLVNLVNNFQEIVESLEDNPALLAKLLKGGK